MFYSQVTNAEISVQVNLTSSGSVVATNLVYINDGQWYTDGSWNLAPADNVILNTTAVYTGSPSWELNISATNAAVDHGISPISPGEQIYFSCWIKTSAPTVAGDIGNPQAGGRIGMDMYGSLGGICALTTPNGVGSASNSYNTYVTFGTSTWTQVTMSFTVPSTYQYVYGTTGQTGHYSTGQMVTPTLCFIWLQVWSDAQSLNEQGIAWFADPVFTITS